MSRIKRILLNSFEDPNNDPVKVSGAIMKKIFIDDDYFSSTKKTRKSSRIKKTANKDFVIVFGDVLHRNEDSYTDRLVKPKVRLKSFVLFEGCLTVHLPYEIK